MTDDQRADLERWYPTLPRDEQGHTPLNGRLVAFTEPGVVREVVEEWRDSIRKALATGMGREAAHAAVMAEVALTPLGQESLDHFTETYQARTARIIDALLDELDPPAPPEDADPEFRS